MAPYHVIPEYKNFLKDEKWLSGQAETKLRWKLSC